MKQIETLSPNTLPMIIDCGTDDFFIDVNRNLHKALLERKIPHDYIERPGGHNWEYWSNAVHYQALFFHRYFTK
jgi:enterochelin esterase-like enzyme